jgi:membrane dipeptidase
VPSAAAAARELLRAHPVFDAHVDSLQRMLDLGHDLGERGALADGQLDLVRGRAGGLGAVVLVCWVDPAYLDPARPADDRARARAAALLATAHELARRHPGRIRLVRNGAELAAARRDGVIAGIPGIEGGHAIEESLDTLAWFHGRGLRVLTLVWNNHLTWIRSCQDGAGPEVPAGLSGFGRDVVRTMNELGMLVDLSHASVQAFHDALEVSTQPVIASHSGCAALHAHPRNLTDEQLRALRGAGGVVGIVFCTPFLDAGARAAEQALRDGAQYQGLTGSNETALFLAQAAYLQRHAPPLPLERVVDHVVHAVDVAGIEHVGIGSDYDGITRTPEGLEDASCYGNLVEALLARGFDEAELELLLGANMRRIFRAVTGPGTRAHGRALTALA